MLFILTVYLPVLIVGSILFVEFDGRSMELSRREIEPSAEWEYGRSLDTVKYIGYTEGRR